MKAEGFKVAIKFIQDIVGKYPHSSTILIQIAIQNSVDTLDVKSHSRKHLSTIYGTFRLLNNNMSIRWISNELWIQYW